MKLTQLNAIHAIQTNSFIMSERTQLSLEVLVPGAASSFLCYKHVLFARRVPFEGTESRPMR